MTKINIVVVGASGGIAEALIRVLVKRYPEGSIYALSRSYVMEHIPGVIYKNIDYLNEESVEKLSIEVSKENLIDLVIVTNGLLHDQEVTPERSLKEVSSNKLHRLFQVNTVIPALITKYFLPKLNKARKSFFVIYSARVGSISDNYLGGWYAYRISKAALNMMIKTASIELKRFNDNGIIIGFHPGTVDTNLSKPFQKNIRDNQLFQPLDAAQNLLNLIDNLRKKDSGKCFAWDLKEIPP